MQAPADSVAVLNAVANLGLCEKFDIFGIPDLVCRQTRVDFKGFHRGSDDCCSNERCRAKRGLESDCGGMATWLPKHRVPVTLYVDDIGRTFIFVCGSLYAAKECVMLDRSLPRRSVVLAHYTEDLVGQRRESRVLVYDVVLYDGVEVFQLCPKKRYQLLQKSLSRLKGLVSLQWVGSEDGAIRNVSWMHSNIPHDIDFLVSLGHDPWVLERLLHVDVKKSS